MRKTLFVAFLLLPLSFSLAGCGKSTELPDITQANCENNPKLLDSLEEETKRDFQARCIMFAYWKEHPSKPIYYSQIGEDYPGVGED
jgi:entry exclusion lipoprotein TrbK